MTDPYSTDPLIRLDVIKVGIADRITDERLARSVDIAVARDHLYDAFIVRLTTAVVAEKLPPQTFVGYTPDPRWATWWDHLKATYRGRWWTRRLSPPRTVDTLVRCDVQVRARWQFPDTPVPREGLGRPILYTESTTWPGQ